MARERPLLRERASARRGSGGIAGVSNKTFKGLTELLVLHLEQNFIANFTGGEFEELTALQELHLVCCP